MCSKVRISFKELIHLQRMTLDQQSYDQGSSEEFSFYRYTCEWDAELVLEDLDMTHMHESPGPGLVTDHVHVADCAEGLQYTNGQGLLH